MMEQAKNSRTGRPKDAAATKAAILNSATAAFTRYGYDGVGAREIAAEAGVTAMLINRYFGSKEGLFTEVVETALAPRTVIPQSGESLSRDLATQLIERTAPESESLDPFLLMLRSAGNPRAAEILASAISRHAGHALSSLLDVDHADERAMLANSFIAGLWLMRKLLALPDLVEADAAWLIEHVQAVLDSLFDPDVQRPGGGPR